MTLTLEKYLDALRNTSSEKMNETIGFFSNRALYIDLEPTEAERRLQEDLGYTLVHKRTEETHPNLFQAPSELASLQVYPDCRRLRSVNEEDISPYKVVTMFHGPMFNESEAFEKYPNDGERYKREAEDTVDLLEYLIANKIAFLDLQTLEGKGPVKYPEE